MSRNVNCLNSPTTVSIPIMTDDQNPVLDLDRTLSDDIPDAIDNKDAVDKITDLLDTANIGTDGTSMAEYKGKFVRTELRDAMVHVVDNMNDQFGTKTAPNITFQLGSLTRLAYDENYKAKNDDPGDCWFSTIKICYKSIGDIKSDVVAKWITIFIKCIVPA
jgi:hypothetical protein